MKAAVDSSRWIKSKQDELAVRNGCYFDIKLARRAMCAFETFVTIPDGSYRVGQPFKALDWQRDEFLFPLYGWRRENGLRRFNRALIWVPKKNGKTFIVTLPALWELVFSGKRNIRVFSAALKRDQAAYIYNNAAATVRASKALSDHVELVESRKRIVYRASGNYYEALSADAGSNEGLNADLVICDEVHAWNNGPAKRLYDAMKFSTAAKPDGLFIEVSTAGDDVESFGHGRYEYAKHVLDGSVDDWESLAIVHEADMDDDWESPETWRKANPSLGTSLPLEKMESDYREVKANPLILPAFRRYRLNQWVRTDDYFITSEEWAAADAGGVSAEELEGMPCWAGLDLALVSDSTAYVRLFDLDDGRFACLAKFFLPRIGIDAKSFNDEVDYRTWAKAGHYELTDGKTTDFTAVEDFILADQERYPARLLGFDPAQATMLSQRLSFSGLNVVPFRQGYLSMSEPVKMLKRLVLGGKLVHFNNPVMRWMATNSVKTQDPAGLWKLDKERSKKRIDGMIALAIALGVMVSEKKTRPTTSVYETRGILTI